MEVRTEIEILAPIQDVWKVLLDFARYPEWNPFIVELLGEAAKERSLDVTLSLPDSHREHRLKARVLACEQDRELRWVVHFGMKGLFDGEHFFRLESHGERRTRLVHGEDFSGILLKFFLTRVTEASRGFVYMNQALKRRVESAATKVGRERAVSDA
jgi:hypothetical protein